MAEDSHSIYNSSSSSTAEIKQEPISSPMMHHQQQHHQQQDPLVASTTSSAISTPAVRSTPIPPPDSTTSTAWPPPARPPSNLSYTSYTTSVEGSPFPQLPVQQAIQPNPYNIHNTSVYPYATDQELQQQMGMTGLYANTAAGTVDPPPVPNFNYHPYAQYPTFYYAQAPPSFGLTPVASQAPPLPTDPAAYYQHTSYIRHQLPNAPIVSSSSYSSWPSSPSSSSSSSSSTSSTSSSSSTRSAAPNHTFVPLNMPQQQKRPRRRYEEIERIYPCKFERCPKSYGTLNHLNAHVQMQKHGEKRRPEEFREVRRLWKLRKKERDEKKKMEEALKKSRSEAEAAAAAVAQAAQVQLIPQPIAIDAPRSTAYDEYYQNNTFDAMALNTLGQASTSNHQDHPPPVASSSTSASSSAGPSSSTELPATQGYDHTTGQFYRQ